MKFNDFKRKALENKDFQEEYKKIDVEIEISKMLIKARKFFGYTQSELAKKINTKQSSIARAESGNSLPSLSFLQKIAEAYNTELIPPKFKFLSDQQHELFTETYTTSSESTTIAQSQAPILDLRQLQTNTIGPLY